MPTNKYLDKTAIAGKTQYPPCAKLKEVREAHGLSQTDLAMLISQHGLGNISNIFISKFECGHAKPWKSAKEALCRATGMSEEELFPEFDQSL